MCTSSLPRIAKVLCACLSIVAIQRGKGAGSLFASRYRAGIQILTISRAAAALRGKTATTGLIHTPVTIHTLDLATLKSLEAAGLTSTARVEAKPAFAHLRAGQSILTI